MWHLVSITVFVWLVSGCASTPPTDWKLGGQPLATVHARWVNGELLVDMDRRGHVYVRGRHLLTLDRAGRIYDAHNEPLALLRRDGMLVGTNDMPMGWVGAGEAILPGDSHSWLILQDSGLLLRSDGDETRAFGQWLGCARAHTRQLCTLISHIIGRELLAKQGQGQGLGLMPGVGVGLGNTLFVP